MVEPVSERDDLEPLSVRAEGPVSGRAVLVLDGELDVFSVPDLRRAVHDAIGNGAREVELDLEGVTFIDSSGLGCIIESHRLLVAEGGRLVLGRRSPMAERLFEVSGIEQALALTE